MLTIKFLILVACVLIGYTLGFIFTEGEELRLSKYRLFQFEAFECRQCLSFHITWVLTTLCSTLFSDWLMFIIGLFFAAMLFTGLYIDEKNKTIKID